jgi:molecular chaperone HscB
MTDYFALLGLERSYPLDEADLERRYHERSKLYHPDRHVKADGVTRVRNALATSELNQAYRVLRDPVKRAEYLLQLEGVAIADEKSGSNKVAPAFLMEMMELREALAEARAEGDEARVQSLGADVRGRRDEAMARVDGGLRALAAGDRAQLAAVADALVALRYYHRFLEELALHEDQRAEAGAEI